jgi:hypothetical protein
MKKVLPAEYHAQLIAIAENDLRIARKAVLEFVGAHPELIPVDEDQITDEVIDPADQVHLDLLRSEANDCLEILEWLRLVAPNDQFEIR